MLNTLVKKTAIPAIALALVSTASLCLAAPANKKARKQTKAETAYYQDNNKAQNSDDGIQWFPIGRPSSFNEP
jgi:hypothetical protein